MCEEKKLCSASPRTFSLELALHMQFTPTVPPRSHIQRRTQIWGGGNRTHEDTRKVSAMFALFRGFGALVGAVAVFAATLAGVLEFAFLATGAGTSLVREAHGFALAFPALALGARDGRRVTIVGAVLGKFLPHSGELTLERRDFAGLRVRRSGGGRGGIPARPGGEKIGLGQHEVNRAV